MYNQSALELSKKNISNQISFLLEAYPYIREVKEIDSVKNMKTDYKYGIDAIGWGSFGQFVEERSHIFTSLLVVSAEHQHVGCKGLQSLHCAT